MILAWFRSLRPMPPPVSGALSKYDEAMRELDDLVVSMRRGARHAARGIISDVVANRDNSPYLTTVFEANAEMKSATEHRLNETLQKKR